MKAEPGWKPDRSAVSRKGTGPAVNRSAGRKEAGETVRGQGELQADEWAVPATPLARGQQSGRQDGFKNTTGGCEPEGEGRGGGGRRAWREVTTPHLRVRVAIFHCVL